MIKAIIYRDSHDILAGSFYLVDRIQQKEEILLQSIATHDYFTVSVNDFNRRFAAYVY